MYQNISLKANGGGESEEVESEEMQKLKSKLDSSWGVVEKVYTFIMMDCFSTESIFLSINQFISLSISDLSTYHGSTIKHNISLSISISTYPALYISICLYLFIYFYLSIYL